MGEKGQELANYMNWLDSFTSRITSFESDLYKYNDDNVLETDKQNVKNIGKLFRIIEQYAENHGIIPEVDQKEYCASKNYYVKHKGKVYQIGFTCENLTIFHCNQVEKIDKSKIIPIKKLTKASTREKVKSIYNLIQKPKLIRTRTNHLNHKRGC